MNYLSTHGMMKCLNMKSVSNDGVIRGTETKYVLTDGEIWCFEMTPV